MSSILFFACGYVEDGASINCHIFLYCTESRPHISLSDKKVAYQSLLILGLLSDLVPFLLGAV